MAKQTAAPKAAKKINEKHTAFLTELTGARLAHTVTTNGRSTAVITTKSGKAVDTATKISAATVAAAEKKGWIAKADPTFQAPEGSEVAAYAITDAGKKAKKG